MGLFTPAWKGKNEEKALAFIEKCRNPELLKRIAREAPSPMRRVAAAERVGDAPELLEEAAKLLPSNVLVDHFRKLAENGDLRGIDILAVFLQEHGQSYDAHRAAVSIRDLYSKASYSGNEELKRRLARVPNGNYGGHTDNHFKDCGYGDHFDSPGLHVDIHA